VLTLFWDYKGPILEHYMSRGLTVNSESYCDLLQNNLKPAVRSKRCGLLSSGVLLHHDNAHPHTAHATAKKITDLHLECIPHPAYSPDLTPSDYHVFGLLMEALGGKKFSTDDEVKEAVHRWLRSQRNFFSWNPGTPALNMVGTMLKSDEVFSILFVHILLVKKY
jgi:histone-lysine N-methyltransferase SETMAR